MAEKTEVQQFIPLIYELPRDGSRKKVTVLSGQNLKSGAVVGRVALGVGRATVPTVVGTGNGVMSNVFAGPNVEKGSYVVTVTTAVANGGVFSVVAPSGKVLASLTLTVGAGATTLYRSSHINFSITDGSTDFAAGDAFTIVVDTTAPAVVGTGNGVISALALGPDAKPGLYQARCIAAATNSGTFEIIDPDGNSLGQRTIPAGAGNAVTFTDNRQLVATITDGSTDFAAGDVFNVAVFNEGSRGEGKITVYTPGTYTGRHRVAGILGAAVDASAADADGLLIDRQAVVSDANLDWGTLTAGEIQAAKEEMARLLGIIVQ